MAQLNHIIVPAHDKNASAKFLGSILGVKPEKQWGPFIPLQTANGVTLDFVDSKDVRTQPYAFLVSDAEFDASFARIEKAGLTYYADPHKTEKGTINHHWGGRGVYFEDANGHLIGRHRSTGIGRPRFWDRARYYGEEKRLAAALDAAEVVASS